MHCGVVTNLCDFIENKDLLQILMAIVNSKEVLFNLKCAIPSLYRKSITTKWNNSSSDFERSRFEAVHEQYEKEQLQKLLGSITNNKMMCCKCYAIMLNKPNALRHQNICESAVASYNGGDHVEIEYYTGSEDYTAMFNRHASWIPWPHKQISILQFVKVVTKKKGYRGECSNTAYKHSHLITDKKKRSSTSGCPLRYWSTPCQACGRTFKYVFEYTHHQCKVVCVRCKTPKGTESIRKRYWTQAEHYYRCQRCLFIHKLPDRIEYGLAVGMYGTLAFGLIMLATKGVLRLLF